MTVASGVPRGPSSSWLWFGLWFSLASLALVLGIDAWQREVPPVIGLLWFLPLAVLVPGMARDRLRSVTWLSFVVLLYFVSAVQRVFAEPGSPRAIAELVSAIALFLCAMFYIRQRGIELRQAHDAARED